MVNIVSRITVEVIGSPKEHVEKIMGEVFTKLAEEEGIKLLRKRQYPCEEMEDNKKLWSTFADIEFETDSMKRVLEVCYDYMPATIEILEPAGLDVDCQDLQELLNDILSKLHKYAMVLKKMQAENIFMMKKLEELTGKKLRRKKV